VAVDLSPAMLKRARTRRAWPASFKFVEGNIDDVWPATSAASIASPA
jgi:ubiquinone/menaquinone biosynthesis C-methylase UbiE